MRSTSKVVALLKDRRVDRGCTPAEEDAATAKATQLSQSEERAKAEAQLHGLGWNEVAAKGIVAALDRIPSMSGLRAPAALSSRRNWITTMTNLSRLPSIGSSPRERSER